MLKYLNILDLIWKEEVTISMMFMIAFWVMLVIAVILLVLNIFIKDKKLDGVAGFFMFMQFLFLIVAITTKDPIFEALGIPKGYEWTVGLLSGGFGLWIYYLNPLKNRVIETEKKVEGMDNKVNLIKDDVSWIKNNCDIAFKK